MDKKELAKIEAYLRRTFSNASIKVQARPRKTDSAEVYVGEEFIDAYVSLINAPTDDKPYGKTYTVKYLGNVVGGKPVVY